MINLQINPFAGREVGEVSSMMRRIANMLHKHEEIERKKVRLRQEMIQASAETRRMLAKVKPKPVAPLDRSEWSKAQVIAEPFLASQPVGAILTPKMVREALNMSPEHAADTLVHCTAYERIRANHYRRIKGPIQYRTKRSIS